MEKYFVLTATLDNQEQPISILVSPSSTSSGSGGYVHLANIGDERLIPLLDSMKLVNWQEAIKRWPAIQQKFPFQLSLPFTN